MKLKNIIQNMSKKEKASTKDTIQEEQVNIENQVSEEVETAIEAEENQEDTAEKEEMEDSDTQQCEDKQDEITLLKKMWEELNDKHLRLHAEFDNYRRRTLKEKMELTKSAGESMLINLLPVMDDFERALAHIEKADALDSLKEGFSLIFTKFKDFLSQNSVKEIETKDLALDTDLHEAITKIPAPEESLKGKIVDCVQKGYTLNDKVIRYAKVVIGE